MSKCRFCTSLKIDCHFAHVHILSWQVGYIIPDIIVRHFLAEYERHGCFRGCCSVGFRWQVSILLPFSDGLCTACADAKCLI